MWRVRRHDTILTTASGHQSEGGLDSMTFDQMLYNHGSESDLLTGAAMALRQTVPIESLQVPE
jgi:hypothetical protein